MKKIYMTGLLSLFLCTSYAQITITNNEMPSANDTARITMATINPFINYAATGPNHTWNFANLRNNGQDLKSYLSVGSTNFVYALYFSNLPFNPNRANVATAGTAIPANPLLTITDPYNFYYRSSSVYKQVGFGAEVSGIPLPVAYTQHDVIYNLPLNYAAQDTSNSAWNIGLPGIGYYGFAQTRINNVDGWGVLTTPHGTFNVLRVKTELYARDTIGVDSLGLNFALDRPKTTEYKWLANNEIVPVMQITTTEIFGLEIVTEIFYRDDYNTVQPGVLNAAYCAGSTVTLPYVTTGSYNAPAFLQAGNVFTAQLSDSTGSFANPVNIGNVTATSSGNVTVTIPPNTPPGTLYRIRFISSSPAVTGGDNGFDISIEAPAVSAIASTGATTFCAGDSVYLQSTSMAAGYSYQWQLNGTGIVNATGSDLYANADGTYTLNTTNSCGTVVSNSITVNVNPLPVASILPSATSFCVGDSLVLNALTDSTYSYQWQLNGVDISGEVLPSLTVTQAGDYSVVVGNGLCGTVTSAIVQVTVNPLPVASILASVTTLCAGDSLVLNALIDSTYSYQWQLNGTDITGEVLPSLTVTQAGDYTVVIGNGLCGTVTSAIVQIAVNIPTVATINTPLSTSICAGDTVMLSAVTDSSYSYQWQLNGADLTGEITSSLVVTQAGDYSVVVNGLCGTDTSAAITITVNPLPTAVITSGNTTVCANDSVVLTAGPGAAYTYQWQLNGTDITGETQINYTALSGGNYTAVVTNGCGNATSNTIAVTVYPAATAPVISLQTDSLVSTPATSYQWYYAGVAITGATNPYYVPTQNGAYTVVITDANGCTAISSIFAMTTVGIKDISADGYINVYPNPASDVVVVEGSSASPEIIISVLSPSGQLVSQTTQTVSGKNFKTIVNISQFAKGLYVLKLESGDIVSYLKFVKK